MLSSRVLPLLHDFGVSARRATSGSRERILTGIESAIRARFVRDSFHSLSTGWSQACSVAMWYRASDGLRVGALSSRRLRPQQGAPPNTPTPSFVIVRSREKRARTPHSRDASIGATSWSVRATTRLPHEWMFAGQGGNRYLPGRRNARATRDTRLCLNGWQRLKRAAR